MKKLVRWVNPIGFWSILVLLALSGCSLFRVNGDAIKELARRMPAPIVEGPPAEKIIDWMDLLALAGIAIGGIAHRYFFHRRRDAKMREPQQIA
jgi:hypothetical protein